MQNSSLSLYFDLVTLKAEPVSRQGRHSTAVWGQSSALCAPSAHPESTGDIGEACKGLKLGMWRWCDGEHGWRGREESSEEWNTEERSIIM